METFIERIHSLTEIYKDQAHQKQLQKIMVLA